MRAAEDRLITAHKACSRACLVPDLHILQHAKREVHHSVVIRQIVPTVLVYDHIVLITVLLVALNRINRGSFFHGDSLEKLKFVVLCCNLLIFNLDKSVVQLIQIVIGKVHDDGRVFVTYL